MLGPISIIDPKSPLPDLLGENGHMRLHPNSYYDSITSESLRLWCHINARYGVPTRELAEWLCKEIGKRKVIEIGAGHGDLAFHLGITATDSYNQTLPEVQMLYQSMRQPTIKYPNWVQRCDASTALKEYKPEVVFASWVTQWVDPDLPLPSGGGSVYGIKEEEILDSGATYILIGNRSIHGEKRIMSRAHEELSFPFLRSRSSMPELNRIWIWNR